MVRKIGNEWCILHAHPQNPNSSADKPAGTKIKCWNIKEFGEAEAKKRATAMHRAIMFSEGIIK